MQIADDNVPPVKRKFSPEASLAVRVVLVIVLSLILVSAMRWAMNVTTENTDKLSGNIVNLRKHFEKTDHDNADSTGTPREAPKTSIDPLK